MGLVNVEGKGQFWGEFGASHCNEWGLRCVVVRDRENLLFRQRKWYEVLWWVCPFVCLSVGLSVCLSARISRKSHGRTSNALCMLPVAVVRSSPLTALRDIHYVTSGFVDDIKYSHNGFTTRHAYYISGDRTRQVYNMWDLCQILLSDRPTDRKYSFWVAHREQNLLSTSA